MHLLAHWHTRLLVLQNAEGWSVINLIFSDVFRLLLVWQTFRYVAFYYHYCSIVSLRVMTFVFKVFSQVLIINSSNIDWRISFRVGYFLLSLLSKTLNIEVIVLATLIYTVTSPLLYIKRKNIFRYKQISRLIEQSRYCFLWIFVKHEIKFLINLKY